MFLSVSMSSPCLSSVLTHANLTMYQTAVSDVLPQQPSVLPSVTTLQISTPAYSPTSGKSNTNHCCDSHVCLIIAVGCSCMCELN